METINRWVRGKNSVTLICIIFPRRARTAEQGLGVVSKTRLCFMQGVRSRGLVWVWKTRVASKESGTSGRGRLAFSKMSSLERSPNTPGPTSPFLHLWVLIAEDRQHPQSRLRVITATLLAKRIHQGTWSAKAFLSLIWEFISLRYVKKDIHIKSVTCLASLSLQIIKLWDIRTILRIRISGILSFERYCL